MLEIPHFQDEDVLYARQLNALAQLPFSCAATLLQLLDNGLGLFCLPGDEPGTTNVVDDGALVRARVLLPDGRPLIEDRLVLPAEPDAERGMWVDGDRLLIAGHEASVITIGAQEEVWCEAGELAGSLAELEKSIASVTSRASLMPVFLLVLSRARRRLRRGSSLVGDAIEALDDCFECARQLEPDLEIEGPEDRRISSLCGYLRRWRELAGRLDDLVRDPGEYAELRAIIDRKEGLYTRYTYLIDGRSRVQIQCTPANNLIYALDDRERPSTGFEHIGSTVELSPGSRQYLHVKVQDADGLAVYAR